jgi:hypothetical protein
MMSVSYSWLRNSVSARQWVPGDGAAHRITPARMASAII